MLRPGSSDHSASVSDRELGFAAMLLLLVVVLAVAVLPAFM